MKYMSKNKKIGLMAIFIAMGLILQYVESRVLISPIPGGKLGLSNMVSIINIFMLGGKNALAISVLRSFLGSLLFGGVMTIPYSVLGACVSTFIMWAVVSKAFPKVSMVGISILGAVFHNLAQLIVAFFMYGSVYVFSYLPGLLIFALISGTVTGFGTDIFANRVLKEDIFE